LSMLGGGVQSVQPLFHLPYHFQGMIEHGRKGDASAIASQWSVLSEYASVIFANYVLIQSFLNKGGKASVSKTKL